VSDDLIDGEADDILDRALREASALQFRTLPTGGGRKGVRLEAAFWEALELQASLAGRRSSTYAGEVLERAQQAGPNATSVLRSLVVADLSAEVKRQRPVIALANMLRMLQIAPVPSFALDHQRRLLQVNAEFTRYVRAITGNRPGVAPVETAQLSLDRPIETLFGELASAAATECGITIRVDNFERRSTARFILVPPLPAVALNGYVLS
jgi:predicted DNA-binding ribbon-helix-helix protein